MAEEGLAFRWLGHIHPRFRTPDRALAAQAMWSCALVATGTYRDLFTRVIYTEWLFFALMTAGLFQLRRRAGYKPVYAVKGYPVGPLVFAVSAVVVAAIQIAADPWKAATGLLLVGLGWPVYWIWTRRPGARR
jgi:APA family basic amino acid/polyamine antiporter